jgi:hypothetical protein
MIPSVSNWSSVNCFVSYSEEQFLHDIQRLGKDVFQSFFKGDDFFRPDTFYSPLDFALRNSYPRACARLLEIGVKEEHLAKAIPFFCSFLMDFAPESTIPLRQQQENKIEVLKLLLQNGADPNAKNLKNGKTGLEYALKKDPYRPRTIHLWPTIYWLLFHGACTTVKLRNGVRLDEILREYLNDSRLHTSLLTPEQIDFINQKNRNTLHNYSFSELEEITRRINYNVREILRWERHLHRSQLQFLISDSFAIGDTQKYVWQIKRDLKADMQRLGEAFNQHGNCLAQLKLDQKRKLEKAMKILSQDNSVFQLSDPHYPDLFAKLTQSLIEKKPCKPSPTLLPSLFFGKRKACLIPQYTKEMIPPEYQMIQDKIRNLLEARCDDPKSPEGRVLCYMQGKSKIEDIGLNPENARLHLIIVKIIDLTLHERRQVLQSTSFPLRTHLLELSSPLMSTAEAYTKTLDVRRIAERNFLKSRAAWIPERTAIQLKILSNELIQIMGLSQRLNHYRPSIWAVRANTAAGKSHAISNDPLFSSACDENGCITGVLNPDRIKNQLKKKHPASKPYLVNTQVHEEGVALFKLFTKSLFKQAARSSLLIESRLSTIEDLEKQVLKPARAADREILLLDIDTPLTTSIARVLARDPYTDQCPTLPNIIQGYQEAALYRPRLLQIVASKRNIKYFRLYRDDRLVVEKHHEFHQVHSQELLKASCRILTEERIQTIADAAIDTLGTDASLLKWKGATVQEAVNIHSWGIPIENALECIRENRFLSKKWGTSAREPFHPGWLRDYPRIIDHIETEHLLHVRGVDGDGRGLHWKTHRFSWKLNPHFNPEAQLPSEARGGFQMKLGYFIISPQQAETFFSHNLSSAVLKELEVRDAHTGKLAGYRFFVHPEAYTHFKPLHAASIPFVKPEHSEFLGTPSSSYRSWVIRRVTTLTPSIPFIVKLGVASTPVDCSRLIKREVIAKCIAFQQILDQMPKKNDWLIFPENFGLALKNIPGYPVIMGGEAVDSGMIVREFPQDLLDGSCQIFSLSSLMSLERSSPKNYGTGIRNAARKDLPLIYEIIRASIEKGLVASGSEFIEKYLIDHYLQAIEAMHFHKKLSFSPHGQNLCIVLNDDNTPRGFAYRDYEGLTDDGQGYLESFSWFYRYHIMIKLLNVLTDSPPLVPPGAPAQLGRNKNSRERNLHHLLPSPPFILGANDLGVLLKKLDEAYLRFLSSYFDIEKARILNSDGTLPAAEKGSGGEAQLLEANRKLWQKICCVNLSKLA